MALVSLTWQLYYEYGQMYTAGPLFGQGLATEFEDLSGMKYCGRRGGDEDPFMLCDGACLISILVCAWVVSLKNTPLRERGPREKRWGGTKSSPASRDAMER